MNSGLARLALVFLLPIALTLHCAAATELPGNVEQLLSDIARTQADFAQCVDFRKELFGIQGIARAPRNARGCAPLVPMGVVLADPILKRQSFADVVLRQLCDGLAQGNDASCDALADIPGNPETGRHICRRLYAMARLSRDLITGSGAPSSDCKSWCELTPQVPPSDLISKVCKVLIRQDFPDACSYIVQWKNKTGRYTSRECVWEMQSLLGRGDKDFCTENFRPGNDVCASTARFRRARMSADAGVCGSDALCRVMMGEGADSCAALDRAVEEQACGAFAGMHTRAQEWNRLDEDCAQIRTSVVRKIEEARPLSNTPFSGPVASRRELAALEIRQKGLETAYLDVAGPQRDLAQPVGSAYSGEWDFLDSPTQSPNREQDRGTARVDASGHFIAFARHVSVVGNIDLATGKITGVLMDAYRGNGTLAGACETTSGCSGTYQQSGPASPGVGAKTGLGDFQFSR